MDPLRWERTLSTLVLGALLSTAAQNREEEEGEQETSQMCK